MVALEQKVYFYNFNDMSILDHYDTFSNPNGLISINTAGEDAIIAYLGTQAGEV